MEDFEKAMAILKKDLTEEDWQFLAKAISSYLWSKDCHMALAEAVRLYDEDSQ